MKMTSETRRIRKMIRKVIDHKVVVKSRKMQRIIRTKTRKTVLVVIELHLDLLVVAVVVLELVVLRLLEL